MNDNFDVIRSRTSFELRFRFDHVFDARVSVSLGHGLDPDQRLDLKLNKTGLNHKLFIGLTLTLLDGIDN